MLKKIISILLLTGFLLHFSFALLQASEVNVPRSGQTASYAAGDDGAIQAGLPWPDPRFTDNGNGTVTDNLTSLIWLKDANCFGTQGWENALTSANSLASGSCNLTDDSTAGQWRLPTRLELESLVDASKFSPVLPTSHPFTGVESYGYWSSSTSALNTANAWNVGMNHGNVGNNNKGDLNYVWPVRGGQ